MVPNETQASQALKSMIKRKLKTKNLMLLLTRAMPNTNIVRIHLNFVSRDPRYQTKHVHSQNVEWDLLVNKRTQQKSCLVNGGSKGKKR